MCLQVPACPGLPAVSGEHITNLFDVQKTICMGCRCVCWCRWLRLFGVRCRQHTSLNLATCRSSHQTGELPQSPLHAGSNGKTQVQQQYSGVCKGKCARLSLFLHACRLEHPCCRWAGNWVGRGRQYRLLVEPLDIANFYFK